jgi:hypothetical protein
VGHAQLGSEQEQWAERVDAVVAEAGRLNTELSVIHAHFALLLAWRQLVAVALTEGLAQLPCVAAHTCWPSRRPLLTLCVCVCV